MNEEVKRQEILGALQDALLNRGEGYSVGQLIAELEGDGTSPDNDPYSVWDEHVLQDLTGVTEWTGEPRSIRQVQEVVDALESYWEENPDLRFCQIICRAHIRENGLADFTDEETAMYEVPLDELTDEQLLDYLEDNTNDAN